MIMSEAETISGTKPGTRTSEIHGLVDNVNGGRIFGWAWNPAHADERVMIELRLGQQIIASTRADGERADLLGAGVGDGRHAFDLPLTPELVERRAELLIVARSADGVEAPLPILGARQPLAAVSPGRVNGEALSRSVRDLSHAHLSLHDRIEALASATPAQASELGALRARVETLELWCLRLDETLASRDVAGRPPVRSRLDRWQMVLAGVAFGSMAATLAITLLGGARLAGRGLGYGG